MLAGVPDGHPWGRRVDPVRRIKPRPASRGARPTASGRRLSVAVRRCSIVWRRAVGPRPERPTPRLFRSPSRRCRAAV